MVLQVLVEPVHIIEAAVCKTISGWPTSNICPIVHSAAATATRAGSSPRSLARVSASRRSLVSAARARETRNNAYRSIAFSPRALGYIAIRSRYPASWRPGVANTPRAHLQNLKI